jgi:protein ImuA
MEQARQQELLEELRTRIARIERGGAASGPVRPPLSFAVPEIDAGLPGGGLALGALHEIAGAGPDMASGAAALLFVAGVLARASGPVLWIFGRRDLFAPSLAGVGLHPDRVIYAETGDRGTVLLAMEEGLHHPGLAGVVGEIDGRLTLTASRRLQLAAENSGIICFALRRTRRADQADLADPIAAETRWRITAIASRPPLSWAPETPGLGRARWRLDLIRCRGGEPHTWIVEAPNAQGRLGLAPDLANRPAAQAGERDRAVAG